MQRVFDAMREERILPEGVEVLALDSTSCKLRPGAHGAPRKGGPVHRKVARRVEPKVHAVVASDGLPVEMHLSADNRADGPEGRVSIREIDGRFPGAPYLMDRAYEGDATRALCREMGHDVVPPGGTGGTPRSGTGAVRAAQHRRTVLPRLKSYRRVCTRYDKPDGIFMSFIHIACIAMWLKRKSVNTP